MCDTGSSGFSTTVFQLRFRLSSHLFFFFGSWLLCNAFSCSHNTACRDTLPSDPVFARVLGVNQIAMTTSSRTKSLTLLPVAPVRWTSWARSLSLRSQALAPPSPPCTLAPRLQPSHTQSLTTVAVSTHTVQASYILVQAKKL